MIRSLLLRTACLALSVMGCAPASEAAPAPAPTAGTDGSPPSASERAEADPSESGSGSADTPTTLTAEINEGADARPVVCEPEPPSPPDAPPEFRALGPCPPGQRLAPTRSVPAETLLRRPIPPASVTHAALQQVTPRRARDTGTPGYAVVRITVDDHGEITTVSVVSDVPTGLGFGAACAEFLRAHATGWQPALDAEGTPVAHTARFSCRFEAAQ